MPTAYILHMDMFHSQNWDRHVVWICKWSILKFHSSLHPSSCDILVLFFEECRSRYLLNLRSVVRREKIFQMYDKIIFLRESNRISPKNSQRSTLLSIEKIWALKTVNVQYSPCTCTISTSILIAYGTIYVPNNKYLIILFNSSKSKDFFIFLLIFG